MPTRAHIPGWTLVSAAAAPLVLMVTAFVARLMAPNSYDPWTQTLSYLASDGDGRRVMTVGFAATAACHIVTSAGLRLLSFLARAMLALVGVCGIAVAAFPVPHDGSAPIHLSAMCSGVVLLTLWPAATISQHPSAPLVRRSRFALGVTLAFSALLAWLCYEARSGGMVGLAERIDVYTLTLWPFATVLAVRRETKWSLGESNP